MLGIGADDIFVLSDAWKQSSLLFGRKNLEKRMEWTISKSSRSIFTTSFTTAVAFFGDRRHLHAPVSLAHAAHPGMPLQATSSVTFRRSSSSA